VEICARAADLGLQAEYHAANGITRDPQGRLMACEAATRRVTREERDRSMTVIASGFQGRRLNFPNDIVVKSDGAIYFTDLRSRFRSTIF
jgi:gluconolactonase